MKNLEDTVQNMISSDYTKRFIAEYDQTKIRRDKLNRFVTKIKAEREHIADKISAYYRERNKKESIEIIDSFLEDTPSDAKPLWFLGKSLELLSTANVAVFARGCVIEHECAVKYGIKTIEI